VAAPPRGKEVSELVRLKAKPFWQRWRRPDERGQTLVEYGLLLALLALVVIVAIIVLGSTTSGFFWDFNTSVQDVT